MKATTRLHDIIQSELIKAGLNEFVNNGKLDFGNNRNAFIRKILRYDSDVQKIVNDIFFHELSLDSEDKDIKFKRTFITKFFNRQIAFQTVEGFSGELSFLFLKNMKYLNTLYDNLDDFILGKEQSSQENDGIDITDNRHLMATLPQREVNLNVDDSTLQYADENTISKTKNDKTGSSKSQSSKHNLDDLILSSGLLDPIFLEIDKQCFLQIW